MTTIAEYEALISKAKIEIENCNEIIAIIKEMSLNLSNCAKELMGVSDSLYAGLIIDGVGQGGNSKLNSVVIKSFSNVLENSIPLVNARIKELNNNIEAWEKAKVSLWAQIASLLEKKKKNKENNNSSS